MGCFPQNCLIASWNDKFHLKSWCSLGVGVGDEGWLMPAISRLKGCQLHGRLPKGLNMIDISFHEPLPFLSQVMHSKDGGRIIYLGPGWETLEWRGTICHGKTNITTVSSGVIFWERWGMWSSGAQSRSKSNLACVQLWSRLNSQVLLRPWLYHPGCNFIPLLMIIKVIRKQVILNQCHQLLRHLPLGIRFIL
jgi:hypothetical protein